MKAVLLTATVLLIASPAMAAPGDPRALRGSLEWPASLSAEPFIVVRGDDGGIYYADVSTAARMSTFPITGPISLVGIEGNQPHEIAAVLTSA
jgi:streptogramin lyase